MLRISASLLSQVFLVSAVVAQSATTAPVTPAPAAGSGFNLLWLLIIVALIAVAVWYFMRRRSTTTTTTGTPPKTGVYDRDKP